MRVKKDKIAYFFFRLNLFTLNIILNISSNIKFHFYEKYSPCLAKNSKAPAASDDAMLHIRHNPVLQPYILRPSVAL